MVITPSKTRTIIQSLHNGVTVAGINKTMKPPQLSKESLETPPNNTCLHWLRYCGTRREKADFVTRSMRIPRNGSRRREATERSFVRQWDWTCCKVHNCSCLQNHSWLASEGLSQGYRCKEKASLPFQARLLRTRSPCRNRKLSFAQPLRRLHTDFCIHISIHSWLEIYRSILNGKNQNFVPIFTGVSLIVHKNTNHLIQKLKL